MKSPVKKRSVHVAGRMTSVSLEDGFWTALKEIAASENVMAFELVSRIDKTRCEQGRPNLSSALRVFVIDHYMKMSADRIAGHTMEQE